MDIKISYQELKANHPDLIDTLVGKIRSANSKDKDRPESEFEWSYSYGMTVKGMNFGDMINKIRNKEDLFEAPKSNQEVFNEKLKSVFGLSLSISSGRTKRYIALGSDVNLYPKLFIDKFTETYMKGIDDIKKEEERLSKLTPEEKDRETQEHINELSNMGGFIGLNMGPGGIKPILPKEINYDLDDILDKIGRVGMDGLTTGEKKFLEQNSK
jgi:hypothetical protein